MFLEKTRILAISIIFLSVSQVKEVDLTAYWPSDWLKLTKSCMSPYFPQVGDIVSQSLASPTVCSHFLWVWFVF